RVGVSGPLDFRNEEVKMSHQTSLAELPVGHLGFGAMRITGQGIWGPPRDESESITLLRRVVDRGVTFIDTADSYGPGISETLIAKALSILIRQGWWWRRRAVLRDPAPTVGSPIVGPSICAAPVRTA